ncbi:MAG: type VI secretion system baseplate subunit TssF [Myxococcales bacterium]|nr:type VI secretion system baseplate subunit TssF [Myxococcales bacterium]
MDPRMLQYYERELRHLREMGGEFAAEFPKIASRLGLSGFDCADPYVERLLESFAFLAARVQLKIDSEFPRFTQHLLELVYPHYLAPTPSMAIVQLVPLPKAGALASGFTIPRGTALRSPRGGRNQTACEYRTAHDVTQWPVEIAEVEYTTILTGLRQLRIQPARRARAMLRIKLRATSGLTFDKLSLDLLPVWLSGGDALTMRLYEQLASAIAIVGRPTGTTERWHEVIDDDSCVRPLGLSDDEALLPYTARSFEGYRLLQEYFAFPQRFLFVELRQLSAAVRRCKGKELELLVLLENEDPTLEGSVDASRLELYCTPAVNLFPVQADRIHLAEGQDEYNIVPDRTRPMDLEVHSVTKVVGRGARADSEREFMPLYARREPMDIDPRAAFYTVERRPRLLSSRQRDRGPRSTYVGGEVLLSLVDGTEAAHATELRQLGVSVLCTNRDLPLHIPVGQTESDFTIQSGAPVERVKCLAGPSAPKPSFANGDVSWRLISHLSLNYLSLSDDDRSRQAGLRELLMLYADLGDAHLRKQIRGLRSVRAKGVVRPLPFPGRLSFGRGVEVTVDFDEDAFDGAGAFLLGTVLERFFAKYVSINSFSETVLRSLQRGEIMRWPPTIGQQQIV